MRIYCNWRPNNIKSLKLIQFMAISNIPNFCGTKYNAERLGRERGLLDVGEKINCQFFASICTGLCCLLAKQEPPTRRIYIHQTGNASVPSGKDRFYKRLEKHFEK